MRLKRPKIERIEDGYGRVYVFKFIIDGEEVWKVGMCHSDRVTERFLEVLASFFQVYRYVPESKIRKFKKVKVPLLVEKLMHELLQDYRYEAEKKFDGSTELFADLDEGKLLSYLEDEEGIYKELLNGTMSMKTEDYNCIAEELGKIRSSKVVGKDVLPF